MAAAAADKDKKPDLTKVSAADVVVNPDKLTFNADDKAHSVKNITITNKSEHKLAIKFKCSNNDAYRVKPVYSFLNGKAESSIAITHLAGKAPKVDRLILCFLPAEASQAQPQDTYKTLPPGTNPPTHKIGLVAEGEKKEEKKEEEKKEEKKEEEKKEEEKK